MISWKTYRLGELVKVKGGKRLPKGISLQIAPNTHPYIRIRDMGKSRVLELDATYEYVDDVTQKSIARYVVDEGDILLSIVGTIGLVGIVGKSLHQANQTENCVKLVNLNGIDPLFLYYFLLSPKGQEEIKRGTVGAVQAKLPIKNIENIEISLPSLEEQRRIAGILGAIDDKIENNRRINTNLELQAQALYKQWFVDNRSDDWETKKLSEFFNVVTGKKDANFSTTDGEYPFFTCSQDVLKAPDYSFEGAAILLAGNGDFNVKRYIGKFEAYQRTYVLIPFDRKYHSFLYLTIKHYLQEITGGSRGSVIKFITKGNIADFEVALPQINIDDKLAVLDSLYQTIDRNTAENHNLATLRDTLLPKLMNGEIKL